MLIALSAVATMFFGLAPMAARALTISPPTFDFTVSPGNTIKDVVRVLNESDEAIVITPEAFNFTAKEEVQGSPDFYPADEERNGYELAPWIKFPRESVTIEARKNFNLEYSIEVPENAQPGGHFGAIHLKVSKPGQTAEEGATVSVQGVTSSLIFVRVTGDLTEELNVAQFAGEQVMYTHLPVDLNLRVENKGTVHLRPVGNVFITNMFGRQVASLDVNPTMRSVLPASARRFEISWFKRRVADGASELTKEIKNFAFGKYTATLVLNYGLDNKVAGASYDFWVIPWQALLLILGVLLAVAFILKYAVRGYNSMVIRRYEALKRQPKE